MVKQQFIKGDIVSVRGEVKYCHDGRVAMEIGGFNAPLVDVDEVTMVLPKFEIGDDVITETGDPYTIVAIYRDFAWIFSTVDSFDTVELASLVRPDPETDPDFEEVPEYTQPAIATDIKGGE